jgi:hypothetical protein
MTSDGRVFLLSGLMTIGRSSSAQIVVRDEPASRMHAELWADSDVVACTTSVPQQTEGAREGLR